MSLLKSLSTPVQQVPTKTELSDAEIMNRVLKSHGINMDEERRYILDQEEELKQRAVRAEAERRSREAEEQKSIEVARELIKTGHIVIKIDGERVEDLAVPCPKCGASQSDVGYTAKYFAERVWRHAGGNILQLVTGDGGAAHLPLSVSSQVCPKCSSRHQASVQLVL